MLDFDETVKSCECKSGTIFDYLGKKIILCSKCSRVLRDDFTSTKPGSPDDTIRVLKVFEFDGSVKSCECSKSGIIVDYVHKKILCSTCGCVLGDGSTSEKPGSSGDIIRVLKIFEFDGTVRSCECNNSGMIIDYVHKKILCSTCGLVLGEDSTSEKASSSSSSSENSSLGSKPDSVGTTNPNPNSSFYDFLPFTVENRGGSSGDLLPSTLHDLNTDGSSVDFRYAPHPIIASFSDRLHLDDKIKMKADEFYNKMEDTNKRMDFNDSHFAACIFLACGEDKEDSFIIDICNASNGVTPANMLNAIEYITKELKPRRVINLKTADYIKWFSSALGMNKIARIACRKAGESSKCVNSRIPAKFVAAMIVYVIGLFTDKNKSLSLQDIEEVTGVSRILLEQTRHDDLFTHLSSIAPKCLAYAKDEDFIDNI